MHYLLFYDVVEDYLTRRAQFRTAHLEHLGKAHDRRELVLAGALAEPADGAVLVFSGSKPGAAEEFAKTDPYVLNGLVTTWKVRKWNTVIGEGSG
ncbi:MAG: YciI-like protein [Thaumarchaeota archaeon]|nr:YciI-like protein [Nitrososphaerota archaeon]